MAEYEKNKSEKGRFKIGSVVERPVMDVPAEPQSSGKYLDKFANSLDFNVGDGNVANQVINDLMNVEEKKADSEKAEKEADKENKEEKKKIKGKEEKLAEEDRENFRKAGQLLALDSIGKAITGEGVSLQKEAAKKGYWAKRGVGAKRSKREYKLLGRIGLAGLRVPLWVATLPLRRPASTAGAVMAAGTGLYGYGKYRKRKIGKSL